jgi:enamine deaminase RidA (YjgF/YER057c/UK114 family)
MSQREIAHLSPPGAIRPTGTWSVGVRAGDFVFVAGMRGIDPATNALIEGDETRVRQAFLNMKTVAEFAGASLRDAVRLVVYVTDMNRHRPIVNKIQEEFWRGGPYPPRSIVEVTRLNQDDIVEVEGTFFCPAKALSG